MAYWQQRCWPFLLYPMKTCHAHPPCCLAGMSASRAGKVVGPWDEDRPPSDRTEQSHPLVRNITFLTLCEPNSFYYITAASVTLLAQVLMLLFLARSYGRRHADIAGQSAEQERLRLASPIWKWSRTPSFCCGYIIFSRGLSLAILSKETTRVSSCIPCLALISVLSIHSSIYPSIHLLLTYRFHSLPTTISHRKAKTTFVSSTLGLEHLEQ